MELSSSGILSINPSLMYGLIKLTGAMISIHIVTNRLSLGLRKQARNENKKIYIYKIARMSQGSIKKKG